jgi:hypothetical protein
MKINDRQKKPPLLKTETDFIKNVLSQEKSNANANPNTKQPSLD